jgi:hypothetical protein
MCEPRIKISKASLSLVLLYAFTLAGCVIAPLPVEEFTLARTALEAARESGADRLAPGLWHTAEEHYRLGQRDLKDKDNESAKKNFLRSIESAEKAENTSRLKKFSSGETIE